MDGNEQIFLSMEEAISAIRIDFCHYPPQTQLFVDLSSLILDPDTRVVNDARYNGLWISTPGRRRTGRMRKIAPLALGRMLIDTLSTSPPPARVMAEICRRTFLTHAAPSDNGPGAKAGVWIYMDMEGFRCKQCGRCCCELNYRHELSSDDYRRWQELGREDILERVATITRNGQIDSYAMWIAPGTRHFLEICPWLMPAPAKNKAVRWICSIHDIKPDICREYPGTKKHAMMTGCIGFGK